MNYFLDCNALFEEDNLESTKVDTNYYLMLTDTTPSTSKNSKKTRTNREISAREFASSEHEQTPNLLAEEDSKEDLDLKFFGDSDEEYVPNSESSSTDESDNDSNTNNAENDSDFGSRNNQSCENLNVQAKVFNYFFKFIHY